MPDLFGELSRDEMACLIRAHHYTRDVPAGKSHYFSHGTAIVVFSIPANPYLAEWLLGWGGSVWELSRLWAPDGHEANLLTSAIKTAVTGLRKVERADALISYADPNVGHHGGIYRAASWRDLGCVEETRYYRDSTGVVVARRAFHSGRRGLTKAEIEAQGFVEEKRPGRLRYARGLTRKARAAIARKELEIHA